MTRRLFLQSLLAFIARPKAAKAKPVTLPATLPFTLR